jgi:hypothetical protein
MKQSIGYQENKIWLGKAIKQGSTIVEIGLDKTRKTESVFYKMETEVINGK